MYIEDDNSLLFTNDNNYNADRFMSFEEINNAETKFGEEDDILSPKFSINLMTPIKEEISYFQDKTFSYDENNNLDNINPYLIDNNIIKQETKQEKILNKELINNVTYIENKKIEEEKKEDTFDFIFNLKLENEDNNEIDLSLLVNPSDSINSENINLTNFITEKKPNILFKTDKNKGKYHILTKEEKNKIFKELQFLSNVEISRKYNISLRNVTRWRKEGVERKKGSGRKFKDPTLEEKMICWYYQNDPSKITTKIFREKAKELSSDYSFKASTGWLVRVQKKYNLSFAKY